MGAQQPIRPDARCRHRPIGPLGYDERIRLLTPSVAHDWFGDVGGVQVRLCDAAAWRVQSPSPRSATAIHGVIGFDGMDARRRRRERDRARGEAIVPASDARHGAPEPHWRRATAAADGRDAALSAM